MRATSGSVAHLPDGGDCEHRFRALFDHAALGIAVVEPGGRIAEVNQSLCGMFGWSADDLGRMTFAELTHPLDREADLAEARRMIDGEIDCYRRENRYVRRDGGTFWGRVTASLVPGQGDRRFAVLTIDDIDERRRVDANLSLFRKVMDASQEGVAILSSTGHLLYANSAYGQLFGLEGSVVGSHYRNYFPPESHTVLDTQVGPALTRGESWEGVIEAMAPTGRRFPLWQRAGVVRDEAGRVKFYFAFMHDHTAQQAFEDQLLDAKEAAEDANSAKTRFLAAASHDLRQPMQALSLFVAVLAGRTMEPAHSTLVARIQDSVAALEGLLNSLLDVSKLEAGLVESHPNDFCVAAMLDRLAAEFEPMCLVQNLRLRVMRSRVVVHSDPALLERVLRNLLNNAVRYTRSGRILLGCRRRGGALRFEVWDTGIGIPAGELKNIFREFHQLGNPERDRRQGLGLGLAIVERLCGLLGHRVTVASQEGKGSMFAVETPLAAGRAPPPPPPRQLRLGLLCASAAIVVIDDEPDVLDSTRLLLESWGHTVLSGTSADDVVARLAELGREPDLVLADYRLRNGDTGGQAVARVESQLEGRVPAIILTGDTAPERLQQAKALGYGLLHKPVQPEALRTAIDEALARGLRARRRAEGKGRISRKAKAG
ncbi:MAG: PAS domain S-box protein [Magnetospirillum sp.]|nr:PAS domain S-box protein [Magnetospirillum sp.]